MSDTEVPPTETKEDVSAIESDFADRLVKLAQRRRVEQVDKKTRDYRAILAKEQEVILIGQLLTHVATSRFY